MARVSKLITICWAVCVWDSTGSRMQHESRATEALEVSHAQEIDPRKVLVPLMVFKNPKRRAFKPTLLEAGSKLLTTLTQPISEVIFPETRASFPEEWLWNVKDLKPVAQGASGSTVFKGTLRASPSKEIVAKRITLANDEALEKAQREIDIMNMFSGKAGFVTMYKSTYKSKDPKDASPGEEVYILMEAAVGTMEDKLIGRSFEEIGLATRWRLFTEVVRAVNDMSQQGIVHRDLKPSNILLINDAKDPDTVSAAICDFGSACSLPGGRWPSNNVVGTPVFAAPEAWAESDANSARDVWSLGIVLYQILFGSLPHDMDLIENMEEIKNRVQNGVRIDEDVSFQGLQEAGGSEISYLLSRMLDPNPESRISPEELLKRVEAFADKYFIDTMPREMEDEEFVWTSERPPSKMQAIFRGIVETIKPPRA